MTPSLRSNRRRPRLQIQSLEARLAPAANPIVTENLLPGNPESEWQISGNGDPALQGFATNFSVNKGQSVSFKITNTANAPYRIDLYRIGYYQGNGARKVGTIPSSATLRQNQPAPIHDPVTNLVDAGNWAVSASWAVPSTAVSGVYIARLVREDTGGASHIIFVVRDDASQSDVLFQTSDTTWQAYNRWGGWSYYGGTNAERAYKVSYNRPFSTRADTPNGRDYFFGVEYAMVRWMEANGFNVSYFSGVDSDRYGSEILEHKLFLSVGHDEYWSGPQRAAVERARDSGVNLAFLSGNEVYWRTRWENSVDGSNTPYRTMVCYKETAANAKIDPTNEWTGTFRDPRFSPPAIGGGQPENNLTGTIFTVNRGPGGETGTPFNVPYEFSDFRFWRDTEVANLQPGQTAVLGDGVLGYEWDEDLDNGFRPAGLFQLSSTTQNVPEKIDAYGTFSTTPGVATHSLTLYRAASGALVFGAGTVQWAWGLDGVHDGPVTTPSQAMRQATVNVFADMGVQPETLQPGLIVATASNDAFAPTTAITAPAAGTTFLTGQVYTISGTASDGGGGRVTAVEVSTDGGFTWRRATGRNSWSFAWTPNVPGPVTIRARAVDDTGNLEVGGAIVAGTATLVPPSTTGQVGVWALNETDGTAAADAAGADNPGTVSGAVFGAGKFGNALTFDGVNDWVTVNDANVLDLTTGMTLAAWVRPTAVTDWSTVLFKERGSELSYVLYAADGANQPPSVYIRLSSGQEIAVRGNSPLPLNAWSHLAATYDGSSLKLYVNGAEVGTAAVSGNIVVSTGALRIGGNNLWGEFLKGQIDEVRVYNRALAASEIGYDMSTPAGVQNPQTENTPPSGSIASPQAGATVSGTVTVTASATDNIVVAGVQFLVDGQPVGLEDTVAPYTYAWDTRLVGNGSHTLSARIRDGVGNVFTTAGTTVTVSNSADSTNPTVRITQPLAGASIGGQAALQALATDNLAIAGVQFKVNGVNVGAEDTVAPYRISWDTSGLAGGAYQVVAVARDLAGNLTSSAPVSVTVDSTAPTVTAQTPAPGSTGVSTTADIAVTFSEPVDLSGMSFVLTTANEAQVATSVFYDSATRTVHFSPNGMSLLTQYSATLTGVKDLAGSVMAPATWSFTTSGAVVENTIWSNSATPATPSAADGSGIEVGVKFRSAIGGYIVGVRFYKGPSNTGTHIGRLWSATGSLLGTVTFTNETATGWQRANFANPIAIAANTTYVISYHAPNGGYAFTGSYFTAEFSGGHLTALADTSGGNGVYRYGAGGAFPTDSFGAANYWVDPVFSNVLTDSTPPTVTGRTPAAGATEVPLGSAVTVTFSESIQSNTLVFTVKDASDATVAGTVSYDDATRTASFQATNPFALNGTYTASVSEAKDLAGNMMAATSWSFASLTADVTAPTVVATTPLNNTSGVAPAVQVTAQFSESVQASTISLKVLDQNNTEVPAIVSYNDVTRTVKVFPLPPEGRPAGCCGTCSHCPLAASTSYTATLQGAKDLAGNQMTPVSWTFTTDGAILNDTLWSGTTTPAVASANDFSPIELGLRIRPEKTGYITGIRFYKGQYNTGTHVGRVWSGEGTLLDSVQFSTETESGWQQANFVNPILVQAGSMYVISYYAPVGGYAYTGNYFGSGGTTSAGGALKALSNAEAGGNGVYRYGAGGGFPLNTYGATNYWVDAVFNNILDDQVAPTVTARTPAAGTSGVPTNTSVTVTFNEDVNPSTIGFQLVDGSNQAIPAAVTYDVASRKATLTPSSRLTSSTAFTATLSGVKDTAGNLMATTSWSFTTGAAVTNATIWDPATVPAVASVNDTAAIELGVRFQSEIGGFVTGIRFYKGPINTGTHVGNLWDASGNKLATVIFTGESATGWQQATLLTPIAIAANTTYVVSYYAPNGGYAYDHGYFNSVAATTSPVKALANGTNGGNGLYKYGTSGFPSNSYNSTNYWVDVVFSESLGDTTAPTIESRTPAAGATAVNTDANISVTFSENVVANSVGLTVRNSSDDLVQGTLTYDPATRTAVFVPSAALGALRNYTVTLSGVSDPSGNAMATTSWSFTTRGTWLQSTTADFAGGTANGVTVSDQNGGALVLAASFQDQFGGTSLNTTNWSSGSWTSSGGGTTAIGVSGGAVSVEGGLILTSPHPGVGVEGQVSFGAAPYQHFGLATDLDAAAGRYWAIFSTGGTNSTLFARVNVSGTMQDVNLGALPSGYHAYKILPTASGFQFYVDGNLATTINLTFPVGTPTRFVASAFNGGNPLRADDIKAANHNLTGTFTSAVYDAGQTVQWQKISWQATTPTNTSVKVEVMTSNDGTNWSNWVEVTNAATLTSVTGRYVQYKVTLTTTDSSVTPVLDEIKLDFQMP
jgi:methionine-rich copper-binding protein CopC